MGFFFIFFNMYDTIEVEKEYIIMDYIQSNKKAWEETFNNRRNDWGKDRFNKYKSFEYAYLLKELIEVIKEYDLKNKTIGQFCSNDGRELLSIIISNEGSKGIGFDISQNMIDYANDSASFLSLDCQFACTNILEIDPRYYNQFDYLLITIGSLTWFKDLKEFFKVASSCLKDNGILFIQDMHPTTNMLATTSESNFDKDHPNKLVNSYFKEEPWIETNSGGYLSKTSNKEHTFYSYSHTLSKIINAITDNGLSIKSMNEYDHDISGLFDHLSHQGLALSYIMVCQKIGK
jgi:2-polyprenyl-3-methyl-5-hydroxy-6-metoxy-1,4-benzoquinol methylase